MAVLCFDISSGGIVAARFDERLEPLSSGEVRWHIEQDAHGRALLPAPLLEAGLQEAAARAGASGAAAVSIACFMHSLIVLDDQGRARTPISTWLDAAATEGVAAVRRRFGDGFHARTGCRYHPMFPVFKLAAAPVTAGQRAASAKSALLAWLTGEFIEDYGMASASGLLHATSGDWDDEILRFLQLERGSLPRLANPYDIAGRVDAGAAARFGLAQGTPVVAGSGDGFFANFGSGCGTPRRIAVSLGTSAVVRRAAAQPTFAVDAGTFCYRASTESFLLGCAGSNGGNALDWARSIFGEARAPAADRDIPIFWPWLHGERSLDWNPGLRAVWHGIAAGHTAADLARSVREGVAFNLAHYVEVVEQVSGVAAQQAVLSGNGFLDPEMPGMVATLLAQNKETLLYPQVGMATLRGAALCAWRALGHDAAPALERLVEDAVRVRPIPDDRLMTRYAQYKKLRAAAAGMG